MFLLETLKKNDNSTANDYYQLNVIGLDIIIFFFIKTYLEPFVPEPAHSKQQQMRSFNTRHQRIE